jgi:hypothetical protein
MKRRMKGASGTAGDTAASGVAVNVRVRVYAGTDGEVGGTVVEDFGDRRAMQSILVSTISLARRGDGRWRWMRAVWFFVDSDQLAAE